MEYQYQCDNEHNTWLNLSMKAPKPPWKKCRICGKRAHRVFGLQTKTNGGVFQPYVERNLPGGPVEVTTAAQRDRLCAKHDVTYDRYSNLRPRYKRESSVDDLTLDEVMTTAKKDIGEWL